MGHSRVVALALPIAFDATLDVLKYDLLSQDVFKTVLYERHCRWFFSSVVSWNRKKRLLPLLFHLAWCGLYEVSTVISVKHELAIRFNGSIVYWLTRGIFGNRILAFFSCVFCKPSCALRVSFFSWRRLCIGFPAKLRIHFCTTISRWHRTRRECY